MDNNARNHRRTCVLLWHDGPPIAHFDWMIEDPGAPPGEGRLLTWRVHVPPHQWREPGRVDLLPLPSHRRDYLTYEGALTGGRGTVHRVDHGHVIIHRWSPDGGELQVEMTRFRGPVALRRQGADSWTLVHLASTQSPDPRPG
jgi:hypothetical protein